MAESNYQKKLIQKLKARFPGCIVMKNDARLKQGIPDLTILFKDKWACLEVKITEKANHQPNQDYKVNQLNQMSYASFIYPENEDEVFKDLEEVFG